MAQVRGGAEAAGSPEFPLAHGRASDRAENGYPQNRGIYSDKNVPKIAYTAAEVAELIRPLTQSVEALQKENAELKQKLEHMNEILANAQRARFGQSSEKRSYVLSEDQMSLFNL